MLSKPISEIIRAHRREMRKMQAQLAEALGIDIRTLQNIEAGVSLPNFETLYQIAYVMSLSTD